MFYILFYLSRVKASWLLFCGNRSEPQFDKGMWAIFKAALYDAIKDYICCNPFLMYILVVSLFFKRVIYLWAVLGLHCCTWAFSSCGEQGLLSSCSGWASQLGGLSSCSTQAQLLHGVWNLPGPGIELVSLVNCRQILYHWATREALKESFFFFFSCTACWIFIPQPGFEPATPTCIGSAIS